MRYLPFLVFVAIALIASRGEVADSSSPAIERVSLDSSGQEVFAQHVSPFISADGRYVAFNSNSHELTPADDQTCPPGNSGLDSCTDIFLHDRETGQTELLRVGIDGAQPNDSVALGDMSPDGRFFAFTSRASNLSIDDQHFADVIDIFVYDRDLGVTSKVNIGPGGEQGFLPAWEYSMSDNGRYVAFTYPDFNGPDHPRFVYVRDMQTHTTTMVSVGPDGQKPAGLPFISGDGSRVLFSGRADDYGIDVEGTIPGLVVRDLKTSQSIGLVAPDNPLIVQTLEARLSPDGSYVTFIGRLDSPSDPAGYVLFGYDLHSQTLEALSKNSTGDVADVPLQGLRRLEPGLMSANNRYVVFATNAPNLVPGFDEDCLGIFVHDLTADDTVLVSSQLELKEANYSTYDISRDGMTVAFGSALLGIVPDDNNGTNDIFVANDPMTLVASPINPCVPERGDVDCNGVLSGADAAFMLLGVAGFRTPAPCYYVATLYDCFFGGTGVEEVLRLLRHLADPAKYSTACGGK